MKFIALQVLALVVMSTLLGFLLVKTSPPMVVDPDDWGIHYNHRDDGGFTTTTGTDLFVEFNHTTPSYISYNETKTAFKFFLNEEPDGGLEVICHSRLEPRIVRDGGFFVTCLR